MILLDRADLELVFHMSTHPSTRYSSLSLGPLMTFKVKPIHKVPRDSELKQDRIWSFTLWFHSCTSCCCYVGRTCASYLVIHPVIPLLRFLLLLCGPHMSQFTCFNVHTREGGHFQFTETRYLMVIVPKVPNVISGTEIIDFFFFPSESGSGAKSTYSTFPDFPWFFIFFLTENKSKKERLQCRTVKHHRRTM